MASIWRAPESWQASGRWRVEMRVCCRQSCSRFDMQKPSIRQHGQATRYSRRGGAAFFSSPLFLSPSSNSPSTLQPIQKNPSVPHQPSKIKLKTHTHPRRSDQTYLESQQEEKNRHNSRAVWFEMSLVQPTWRLSLRQSSRLRAAEEVLRENLEIEQIERKEEKKIKELEIKSRIHSDNDEKTRNSRPAAISLNMEIRDLQRAMVRTATRNIASRGVLRKS